jgi:hypothetical protein
MEGSEGQFHLRFHPDGPQDPHSGSQCDDVVDQGCLANAGFAAHDEDLTRPMARSINDTAQRIDFPSPTEQSADRNLSTHPATETTPQR